MTICQPRESRPALAPNRPYEKRTHSAHAVQSHVWEIRPAESHHWDTMRFTGVEPVVKTPFQSATYTHD